MKAYHFCNLLWMACCGVPAQHPSVLGVRVLIFPRPFDGGLDCRWNLRRVLWSKSAGTFGEYVAFVSKALKIKLALKEIDHSTPRLSYNYNEYVHVKNSEVANRIDEIVDEIRSSAVKSARA